MSVARVMPRTGRAPSQRRFQVGKLSRIVPCCSDAVLAAEIFGGLFVSDELMLRLEDQ